MARHICILAANLLLVLYLYSSLLSANERDKWGVNEYLNEAKVVLHRPMNRPNDVGDYLKAIDILKDGLRKFESNPQFYAYLSSCYMELRLFDSAMIYFDSLKLACQDTLPSENVKQVDDLKDEYKKEIESQSSKTPSRDLWPLEYWLQLAKNCGRRFNMFRDPKQEKIDQLHFKIKSKGPYARYYVDIGRIFARYRGLDEMKAYFDSARVVCSDPDIDPKYKEDCDTLLIQMDQMTKVFEYQVELKKRREAKRKNR